jgi:hypothetical protein
MKCACSMSNRTVFHATRPCRTALLLVWITTSTWGQPRAKIPRFEDFPVREVFKGTPARPILATPDERRFRTVITQGMTKGWGAEDGTSGKEPVIAGPNFAGHYVIVRWGCGSPCLMMAIVDSVSGRVFSPPFHHGPGHSYFQLPWAFPAKPLTYRIDSRLLITNVCESDKTGQTNGRPTYEAQTCGTHYFVMEEEGLRLIYKIIDK